MELVSDKFIDFVPLGIVLFFSFLVLGFLHFILLGRHKELGNERKFPRQIIISSFGIVAIIFIIFVLPIADSSRNQLMGLIGILLSGIIAFSSTTIVSNLMAGILLRITKPFRTGDFIRVGEDFGRVTERGLFDTEIQTEMRELIAFPNSYLISNPVVTIRSSGTIVSVSLSLGYDVHNAQVDSLLIKAAEATGLEDPFVHILELGNYSVTYRISGLLKEIKKLISVRSSLYRTVLDTLHGEGVEIMSPVIQNQRRVPEEKLFIPKSAVITPAEATADEGKAESIVFDKAEEAERTENERNELVQKISDIEEQLKTADETSRDRLKAELESCRVKQKELESTEE